ncbi:MAG TPA: ADP-ribosylglycohydrolase family protein [Planctomycetota bacterium]|jgi:ADP-ribosylglycohydrolase
MTRAKDFADTIAGALLGTAVGDAIGLPREGLSRGRALRMFGAPPLRHRFLFGRGMCSDDTEHAIMVAQALLASGGEPKRFARTLAWHLRWWLLGVPAGVGWATLRSILRLWLGYSPENSGVYSAGNGPAMRSALIGLFTHDDLEKLKALVRASTRLTHTDPRAEEGALAVALAARACLHPADSTASFRQQVFGSIFENIRNAELVALLQRTQHALEDGASPEEFAAQIGCEKGISGFVCHTVPAAIFCWLRYPQDFRAAVEAVIMLGGDADTTGAITGALAGASVGAAEIPDEWLGGIVEWPRNVPWMRRLAAALASGATASAPTAAPRTCVPCLLARNIFFAAAVLGHGFRRVLPPY